MKTNPEIRYTDEPKGEGWKFDRERIRRLAREGKTTLSRVIEQRFAKAG